MGLLTLTQIPCHHVLANKIDSNLKYRIGLKHFFNINLGIGIIRKTNFFVHIFNISPCVSTQISIKRARWMRNYIMHPTSTHSTYLWRAPLPPKKEILENTWWWHHHHVFSSISCSWGSGAHQRYADWVLIGCGIKFRIQQALLLRIWVKPKGDMSKIRTQKVVFFILPPKLITIILLF